MFQANVEDETLYERDPENPNFLKRKPSSLNGKIGKDLNLSPENQDKFDWLLQNHRDELFTLFGVQSTDGILSVSDENLEKLHNLYRRLHFVKRAKDKNVRSDETVVQLNEKQQTDILSTYINSSKTFNDFWQAVQAFVLQETGQQVDDPFELQKVFVKLLASDPKYKNLFDQLHPIEDQEPIVVQRMETELDEVLKRAMSPLYRFIGCIDVTERYSAKHYSHFYPLNKGSKTLTEFRDKNRHLGDEVLFVAANYARRLTGFKSPIKTNHVRFIGMQFPKMTVRQKDIIGPEVIQDLNKPGVPEWIYCLIGNNMIRFMLTYSTYGAIEMAAKELGFDDFKPLIDSPDVSYKFAEYVAHKFFTAQGGMAQVGGLNGGNLNFRVSSGFSTIRQANHKWLMACRLWFKDVGFVKNPQKEKDWTRFKEAALQAEREYNDANKTYLDTISMYPDLLRSDIDVFDLNRTKLQGLLNNIIASQTIWDLYQSVQRAKENWKDAEIAHVLAECAPDMILKK